MCELCVAAGKNMHDIIPITSVDPPVSAAPTFALDQIVNQLRTQWGEGGEGTYRAWFSSNVSYSIADFYPSNLPYVEQQAFVMSAVMKNTARLGFELWDDAIAINLTESVNNPAANITMNFANLTLDGNRELSRDGGTYARASVNSAPSGGYFQIQAEQIWLNKNWTTHDQDSDLYYGGFGVFTYMHEIGHTLGLSHPGTYNAGNNTITYAAHAEFAQDNRQYTIMSYFGGYNSATGAWTQDGTDSGWYYPSTPMVFDIAAIQATYGADYTTRAGDSIYGFNVTADVSARGANGLAVYSFSNNPHPIFTIWDGGGTDTLDCSGYSIDQVINLMPGAYSDVGGMRGNIGIAYNCYVENAIGGTGSDLIIGNDVGNRLQGGDGNDIIFGWGGDDTFVFTSQVIVFNITGNTFGAVTGGHDAFIGWDGADTANFSFLGTSEYGISMAQSGADFEVYLTRNGATKAIVTLTDIENIIGTSGNDSLLGSLVTNILDGGLGDDRLDGKGGADTMNGGLGNDTYFVDNFGDLIVENPGQGQQDTVQVAVSGYTMPANVENGVVGTAYGLTLNARVGQGSILLGNSGDDLLNGNSSDDQIVGGGGNDVLKGGAGTNILNGGTGFDEVILSSGHASFTTNTFNPITGSGSLNFTANNNSISGTEAVAFTELAHGGPFNPAGTQYADLNNDRRSDLIYQGVDNKFWVSLSNGPGLDAPRPWVAHGGAYDPTQTNYADLNSDGRADLIYQGLDNKFWVSLSSGLGFATPQAWVAHGGPYVAGEAKYADLNSDGRTDLIYQGLDNKFWVSLSTGSGFTTPNAWVSHGGPFVAGEANYADVNNDQKADLVYQGLDNKFWVSLSTGSGFTTPNAWVSHGGPFIAGEAQFADLNNDGMSDLIYQGLDNKFWVSLSTGSGFKTPQSWASHGGPFVAGQAQYADLNADHLIDLVYEASDHSVWASLSTGSGFASPQQIGHFDGDYQASDLHIIMANNDVYPDLILQNDQNQFLASHNQFDWHLV